jgi:hypothetical protein
MAVKPIAERRFGANPDRTRQGCFDKKGDSHGQ